MTSKGIIIKMVEANDYQSLGNIMLNKKINLNFSKNNISLIHKAVEVRARECFDLLINNSAYTYHQENSWGNGVDKAMEYYKISQNPSNEYYLMRLIEKKADCSNILKHLIEFPNMFSIYFDKMEKNSNNVNQIIKHSITANNLSIVIFALDYAQTQNWTFDYNVLFELSMISSFILGMKLFIEKGCNWKIINGIPTIYHIIKNENHYSSKELVFDFIFDKFYELDKNELNQIPGIKNLNQICESYFVSDFRANCVANILTLDIDFVDLDSIVYHYINKCLKKCYPSFSSILNFKTTINNNILMLNALLSGNKIKSNPLESFSFEDFSEYIKQINNVNGVTMRTISEKIIELFTLFEFFGFSLTKTLKDELRQKNIIDIDSDIWTNIKKDFISKIKPKKNIIKKPINESNDAELVDSDDEQPKIKPKKQVNVDDSDDEPKIKTKKHVKVDDSDDEKPKPKTKKQVKVDDSKKVIKKTKTKKQTKADDSDNEIEL